MTEVALALPRETREGSKVNDLRKSLGLECAIAFQCVSPLTPKLSTPSYHAALIKRGCVVGRTVMERWMPKNKKLLKIAEKAEKKAAKKSAKKAKRSKMKVDRSDIPPTSSFSS